MRTHATAALILLITLASPTAQVRPPAAVTDPASLVDTRIGTAGGGNVFPGAVVPFGMVQWSPETTRGDSTRAAAPGGYAYDATTVRGFSLTHLSGTGCRGASGDIPFMPYIGTIRTSPSADTTDRVYTTRFSHANETATPGFYAVRLASGVKVELTATARTGAARFTFPKGTTNAHLLVRASDSEVGSSEAQVTIDQAARTITGSVTSGNFCGYLDAVNRRSYYTLHFVAVFDRPFTSTGAWENKELKPGATSARGGTTYGTDGYPVAGTGSGVWVGLDASDGAPIDVRVGISYVSLANAEANLRAENRPETPFDAVKGLARSAWSDALRRIQIAGGSTREQRIFYTALYHSLLHPNLFSDVNGEYWGLDQKVHTVAAPQKAQYANFSGWDVYRSQVQLVALLDPAVASDIAQSLLNQADHYGGVWDRWTHNSGATHVMEGDASAPAVASMYAFGATSFDVKRAFASLVKAATVPTRFDLSDEGCRVSCVGQRPSLDKWLSIKYIPTVSNAWGGAGETLEDVSADFALAQLAQKLGDAANHQLFLARSDYWRNIFNPKATPDRGYIQNRNEDGTWPRFEPASSSGFAEGSSAQYTWMIPFNPRGLFDAMGGIDAALARLDEFFRNDDGTWALTRLGGMKAEMDNEPSIGAPWLYSFAGRPDRTQATVRAAMTQLWSDTPHGIPGNDDLGAMSSWYVWSAIGLYPYYPGRAELLLGSPLFPRIVIARSTGKTITITAPEADADAPFVHALRVNGRASTRAWLPETFAAEGGTLEFRLLPTASDTWGRAPADAPPSFGVGGR
jgi:predicted alpha-1,2-mannosidase